MQPPVTPALFCLLMLLGMLVMIEIGHRIAVWRRSRDPDDDKVGLSTVEGAIFALFGLMIAFTRDGLFAAATVATGVESTVAEPVS